MAYLIVETEFEKPLTDAELKDGLARLLPCIQARHVRWVRSYLSSDRRRKLCEFEGPDAESLRQAMYSAGVPIGRVWTAAKVVRIEDHPDWLEKRDKVRTRLKT